VVWVKPREKISVKWGFEKKSEMNHFKLIRGQIQYGEKSGVDNSNGVEVEFDTVLEIDISRFQLPLKITYSFDSLIPKGQTSKGFLVLKSNYPTDKNILSFIGLSPTKSVDITKNPRRNNNSKFGYLGEWTPVVVYITEECVELWLHGNRTGLCYGTSRDNKKLYINFKDRTLFDNFTIESVNQDSVSDISSFKNFASTLSFIKGFKNFYRLESEISPLNLDKNSQAQLGICDNEVLEESLGLRKAKE
jgi:hypothetical protein